MLTIFNFVNNSGLLFSESFSSSMNHSGNEGKKSLYYCHGLAPASNKEPRACSITRHPWWNGEENREEKGKIHRLG